jgi:acylglycerol lipase
LGLHNATYQHFGERMAKAGIATYAVDVRGFGSWQQAAGRADVDFEDCLTDVADTLKFIHKANPGLPVFILGESMGGAIALRVTSKYPELVDGLISCVPSGDRFKQRRSELKVALHFLGGGANRKFDVGSEVIEQASSSSDDTTKVNEGLKSAWANDPLAKLKLSPKELIQFQRFMNENHDVAKTITTKPVLMVQGWEDNLVKWQGTLELWNELPTDDKQIELIPNAKHLIFEESQFNDQALNVRVDKMVTRWIDDHIVKKPDTVGEASNSPKP